jgi:hypothetical protein
MNQYLNANPRVGWLLKIGGWILQSVGWIGLVAWGAWACTTGVGCLVGWVGIMYWWTQIAGGIGLAGDWLAQLIDGEQTNLAEPYMNQYNVVGNGIRGITEWWFKKAGYNNCTTKQVVVIGAQLAIDIGLMILLRSFQSTWQAWLTAWEDSARTIGNGEWISPKVLQAAKKGREIHRTWEMEWYQKEVYLGEYGRADRVNFDTNHVIEIKPNNPRAIQKWYKQVWRYIEWLEKNYPWQKFTGEVKTY